MNDQASVTLTDIEAMQLISYGPPQYLVKPFGPILPTAEHGYATDAAVTIESREVSGWGDCNAIVRIDDEDGWSFYLAVLKEG